jgi:hypothetical protein
MMHPLNPVLAAESQAFSLKRPANFFTMFGPPRNDSAFKAAREQLEEELRFSAKMVRDVRLLFSSTHLNNSRS